MANSKLFKGSHTSFELQHVINNPILTEEEHCFTLVLMLTLKHESM